jgi:hypothetical protein
MEPLRFLIFFFKILHAFISSKIDNSVANIIIRCEFLRV